jgi:hypothetical protein
MGEFVLTGLVADQQTGCERLSFNPDAGRARAGVPDDKVSPPDGGPTRSRAAVGEVADAQFDDAR